ncbi:DUF4355 domain-containing protein [Bacillus paranthracis]|uniref:head scaffolding protein n=1 Tax=Bacillus phage phi4B1 TaxID=1643324 RepID=UPI000200F429|nr:DUF4355 domain-containing protein [Bacillus paranthracis]YP_009206310.1 head scaffolding protein [Bacillus phage phi4B1]ADY20361.1 hypothetical protein YBT020_05575 [Bacillus thuringiensis serovar finitimus YBT-020]MED3289254.1 DUF4355 domain-containing protein [Bacillus thuringiensis]OTX71303.1 hypothetical protein BK722_12885 [Bacillus thuringiensis serovar finitimus]PGZ45699.1 DUF4355 domain-containing protein [Bacillus anthracis]ALF02542.1 hypothetical protein XO26_0011 [Bacillus phage
MKTFKENKFPLRLNLQFFSEENPNPEEDNPNKETDPEPNPNDPPEKTFTQADVDALIAKEKKRAAKRAREEAEKEYQRKSMTEEERRQQEYEDLKKENESYKAKARRAELKDHATELLRAAGVPTRFANRLIGEDEETTSLAANEFIEEWKNELSSVTKTQLSDKTPLKPNNEKPPKTDKAVEAFNAAWDE